jgi:hypothetical protein
LQALFSKISNFHYQIENLQSFSPSEHVEKITAERLLEWKDHPVKTDRNGREIGVK